MNESTKISSYSNFSRASNQRLKNNERKTLICPIVAYYLEKVINQQQSDASSNLFKISSNISLGNDSTRLLILPTLSQILLDL